ncbi:MAG TPA: 50S ribosomal protein L23 [Planctomycetota bacterium]|nr:50S ribosomal protein L23 [Planctomycetota bacterium]
MSEPWTVLKSPQLSEKVQRLQKLDTYVFVVELKANKTEVKNAVEKVYGVKVASVRTAVFKGKAKRDKNMVTHGRRKDWKKAYVRLKSGHRLDII